MINLSSSKRIQRKVGFITRELLVTQTDKEFTVILFGVGGAQHPGKGITEELAITDAILGYKLNQQIS